MVHRDDPIVDRKLAYHYQVTMHIHAHACRVNSAILDAAEDNPGNTCVSAANAPRGCWVSVYAGYTGAVAVN